MNTLLTPPVTVNPIRWTRALRVIVDGVTLDGITRREAERMLTGRHHAAFCYAVREIERQQSCSGLAARYLDTPIQVDLI